MLAQAVTASPRSYRSLVVGHPSRRLTMPKPLLERRLTGDDPLEVRGDWLWRRNVALIQGSTVPRWTNLVRSIGLRFFPN